MSLEDLDLICEHSCVSVLEVIPTVDLTVRNTGKEPVCLMYVGFCGFSLVGPI